MQRFPYMTNEQALYTMYTTGRQNSTISDAMGNPVPNPGAGRIVQVPDSRNGWHTPSLREAMNGPGQLLGRFDVDTRGAADVWSNDISDIAVRARQQEDADEAAAWRATKAAKGWTHGLPHGASDADKSEYATGTAREKGRKARVYDGSLTKRGAGTLFLAGNDTWHGPSTVVNGKLSILGAHASSILVRSGSLGGSGSVTGDITITGGELRPGLTAEEARGISRVRVEPGNVLNVGGGVRVGGRGGVTVAVRGDDDYTSLRAAGDLALDGKLTLNVHGKLTPGAVLTILSGDSIKGTFHGVRDGQLIAAGGYLFRVSYRDHSVTLTVARKL
jgi:subtilase-type serine protease